MKIKPVLHRILVKPKDLEKKTESGIIIQWDKREENAVEVGTVVDIGSTAFEAFSSSPDKENIKVGSTVYFAKYAGKRIQDGEEKYLVLNDEDIVGVINE